MPWKVPTQSGADGQAQQRLDAVAHLGRGLVGEGDREDAVRRDALDLHQPRDPVREHARLAAAGAGEHERGASGAVTAWRCASLSGARMWETSMGRARILQERQAVA